MSETRKLAAILVADVVGYSRLAGADQDRTLARLRGLRSDLIDLAIAAHRGRIVKRTGDGIIVEFRSVVDAVRGAIEVQSSMIERNAGLPPERRIDFRVGIHLGDVVEEADGDLIGDGVNIAARLEGICKAGLDLSLRGRLPAGEQQARYGGHRSRADPTQEHRKVYRGLFVASRRPCRGEVCGVGRNRNAKKAPLGCAARRSDRRVAHCDCWRRLVARQREPASGCLSKDAGRGHIERGDNG
jgi:class 3 adenylate cyclase